MVLKRGAHLKFIALWLVAGAAFAADLPIRDVTIYKHGVAYVERAGDLKAGETARLDFKAEDMNDVLKSLTITDRNGGKVAGVRYDASDPLRNGWRISVHGRSGGIAREFSGSGEGRAAGVEAGRGKCGRNNSERARGERREGE